ncbi:MAG: cyclic lactone autoinducer peptide [Oscillospiraceae bacterium]|nr:cyclic lactone autoinducer peptide [Oscillospiraceae bacterium]
MKAVKSKVLSVLVKATYHIAEKGAGLASFFGIYQPEVPKKLQK